MSFYRFRKAVMKITWPTALSICILIVVSTLDAISPTSISWTKYRYGSEFDGFMCILDDTLFVEDDVTDHVTCGKICYNTYQCLDFFFQHGKHRCIGCRVHILSAFSTKRIGPLQGSTHFSVRENSLKKDCYIPGHGALYRGYQRKTRLNRTCQRWDTQNPHTISSDILEESFPEKDFRLAENYCRDPDATGRPWCYTTDPNHRWNYCDIPLCTGHKRECLMLEFPELYEGVKNVTKGNLPCQHWDQQSPHEHHFTSRVEFPDASIKEANNYCRSLGKRGQPWCYTTNKNKKWDFCDVKICNKRECFMLEFPEIYEGVKNVTKGNLTCQRWDQQSPQKHDFTSLDDFPDASIKEANNYCRSPNRAVQPWCYTTNENKRWDFCDVEICELDYCFYESASTYQGGVYYTERRVECQRWDSTEPHSHDFGNMTSKFPDATVADAANYCRDPDGTGRPWCYTTDPNTRWDLCNVKKCWDDYV